MIDPGDEQCVTYELEDLQSCLEGLYAEVKRKLEDYEAHRDLIGALIEAADAFESNRREDEP